MADPAFYDRMSALLDEIIAARKAKAIEYEDYLKKIAELVTSINGGMDAGRPADIKTNGQRALYNNLSQDAELVRRIDAAVKNVRPEGWRGVQAREQMIKAAIFGVVKDQAETERIFAVIYHQREY